MSEADVLPIIVFLGSLFAILYHGGVVQRVVSAPAAALSRALGASGAESLAAGERYDRGHVRGRPLSLHRAFTPPPRRLA